MQALPGASERKIQRLGGSSLIVTIPKAWARRVGLKPGDNVIVIDDGDSLRIMPSRRVNGSSGLSVRVRYGSALKSVGLIRLARCSLVFGYKRLVVEATVSHRESLMEEVQELEEEMGDAVESITFNGDELIVEFSDAAQQDRSRLLKAVNSSIQEILDAIDEKARLGASTGRPSIDVHRVYAELMRSLIASTTMASGKAAAELVAMGMIHQLIELALALYDATPTGAPDVSEAVSKLKLAVSEALGGLAAGSTKRTINAVEAAEEVMRWAREEGNAAYHGIIYSLALIVKNLALKALCSIAIPA